MRLNNTYNSVGRYGRLNPRGDFWLFFLATALALIGLMMILSSSVVISFERFGSNYYYVARQSIWFLIGLVFFALCANIHYKFWQQKAFTLLVISLVALLLVFVPGIGLNLGGAHRWLSFGSIVIQPSEIIKLTFIIYLAAWLESKGKTLHNFQEGLLPFATVLLILIFLIIKQPDMGTVLIITAIAGIMFYLAEAPIQYILGGLVIGFLLFFLLIKVSPYRWERLKTYLEPESNTLGSGYQINQSMLAIGSGGLWGLGFGNSKQKYLYLPQAQSDAIFAIMVEELGFIRISVVLAIFLLLILRLLKVLKNTSDPFARLLAGGAIAWIAFQTILNIFAITGLIPLTGIPLPFISSGGSSLVMLFSAVGIVYNISKY